MSSTPTDKKTDAKAQESLLYKEFLAEREEILRHKWIESEKAGHDVGLEFAALSYINEILPSRRDSGVDITEGSSL
jgi:hypothetical protein